jgi:hypothetical protein
LAAGAESPATALSDPDLERIAADEGWDSSDVAAMRAYLDRNAGRVADEPGTEAGTEVGTDLATDAEPDPEGRQMEPAAAAAASAHEGPVASPPAPAGPPPDQDWLRGRRGTAAGAYRRLRRLFDS